MLLDALSVSVLSLNSRPTAKPRVLGKWGRSEGSLQNKTGENGAMEIGKTVVVRKCRYGDLDKNKSE